MDKEIEKIKAEYKLKEKEMEIEYRKFKKGADLQIQQAKAQIAYCKLEHKRKTEEENIAITIARQNRMFLGRIAEMLK
jgi:uncharacterized surface protein with fasciclin (FAS1) repeats